MHPADRENRRRRLHPRSNARQLSALISHVLLALSCSAHQRQLEPDAICDEGVLLLAVTNPKSDRRASPWCRLWTKGTSLLIWSVTLSSRQLCAEGKSKTKVVVLWDEMRHMRKALLASSAVKNTAAAVYRTLNRPPAKLSERSLTESTVGGSVGREKLITPPDSTRRPAQPCSTFCSEVQL